MSSSYGQTVSRLPLAGIRIVDFTWAWAGPQATLLLGMLGAEIIKIESRARLDHTRLRSLMSGPTLASPDHSVIFAEFNVNKLSLTLNLTNTVAVEIIKRLVEMSDVVAENMRPGERPFMACSRKVSPIMAEMASVEERSMYCPWPLRARW